jgi:hypothetical protein
MQHKIKSMFVIGALVVSTLASTSASANTLELSSTQDCRGFGNIAEQAKKVGSIGITLKDLECDQEVGNAVARKFIRIRRPDGRTEDANKIIIFRDDGTAGDDKIDQANTTSRKFIRIRRPDGRAEDQTTSSKIIIFRDDGTAGDDKYNGKSSPLLAKNKLDDDATSSKYFDKSSPTIMNRTASIGNQDQDKGGEDGSFAKNCVNGKHFTTVKIEMAKTSSKPSNPEQQETIDCHLKLDEKSATNPTDSDPQETIDCHLKLDAKTVKKDPTTPLCGETDHLRTKNYIGHVTIVKLDETPSTPMLVKDTKQDPLAGVDISINVNNDTLNYVRTKSKDHKGRPSTQVRFSMTTVTGSNNGSNTPQSYNIDNPVKNNVIIKETPVTDSTTGPAGGSTGSQGGTDETSSSQL